MKKIIFFLTVIIVVLGFSYYQIEKKTKYDNFILEIDSSKPLRKSLETLPIAKSVFFKIYLKLNNGGKNIKAGYYEINGDYNIKDLISILESGKSKGYKFTIIEGYTVKNVIDKLVANGIGEREKYLSALNEIEFPYLTPNKNYEGYFYPETYIFNEGVTTKQVLQTILNEFLKKFPPEKYPDKQKFYDQLKLASIVEAEVSDPSDKPKVAGIFIKRLEIDMKLESDATLKYELGRQALRGELKTKETPYNSYKVKGLPPTPIGNPPVETFRAVEKAEVTDDLFFFTYKGKTYYSKTHEEHLKKRRESGQLK